MAPLQAMIVKLALVILFMGSGCRGFFLRMSALGGPGKVLGPGAKGGWDDFKVSGPVVRPTPDGSKWNMWYYGRSEAFNKTKDLINLPSGSIGLAESTDGVRFSKVKGPSSDGSLLGPTQGTGFDSLHVGIGDIRREGDRWAMYYFGGDGEYGPTPYGMARGIFMRIGKATSADGLKWERQPGPILDRGAEGEFDSLFVSWPQIVELDKVKGLKGELGMYYHTFNTATFGFEVGLATSKDDGKSWTKRGPVMVPRGERGTYRDYGHATRCVVPDPTGKRALLMFAECVNSQLASCIGVYGSDDGVTWDDMHEGPVFKGAGLGTGAWDAQALGCPSVIVRDGRFYMYYVGFSESRSEGAALGCVGLAVSEGYDYTRWSRVQV